MLSNISEKKNGFCLELREEVLLLAKWRNIHIFLGGTQDRILDEN